MYDKIHYKFKKKIKIINGQGAVKDALKDALSSQEPQHNFPKAKPCPLKWPPPADVPLRDLLRSVAAWKAPGFLHEPVAGVGGGPVGGESAPLMELVRGGQGALGRPAQTLCTDMSPAGWTVGGVCPDLPPNWRLEQVSPPGPVLWQCRPPETQLCQVLADWCFPTCTQVSQEAGQLVCYSHLLKNFPQFFMIHTVKGFGIVNKAEVDAFLEFFCFFYDPVDVVNLISGSSAFSKSSLNIWKFTVHVLLKPGLENF